MTFDEWHKENAKYMEPADIVHWCAAAWEAGAAAGREECIDIAEQHGTIEGIAQRIIADIRARGQNV